MRSLFALVACALLGVAGAAAQTLQVQTGFERDVNRYRWSAGATWAQAVGAWRLEATPRFVSDAYLLAANRLRFRDETQLAWQAVRPLGGRLAVVARGQGAWFSQARVLSHEAYAGLRLATGAGWSLEPGLGYAFDRRPGALGSAEAAALRADAGPALALRLRGAPRLEGYQLTVVGEGAWQRLAPRRAYTARLETGLESRFGETRLAARTRLGSLRRDAYQAVSFLNRDAEAGALSESIEATRSDTLLAGLDLEAPMLGSVRFVGRLDAAVSRRRIRTLRAPDDGLFFDTDTGQQTFEVEGGLATETPRLQARLTLRGGAQVERRRLVNREALPPVQANQKSNLLRQADYDQGQLALQGRARLPLGRFVLAFDGTTSILRHDTPDVNPDDRDELLSTGQLALAWALSRYVQADVRVFGSFYHTVYLSALRSAENNVQRSLRLRPALVWTPSPRLRLRLGSEVRATYTVDDFVLPGRRPSDQAARELRYELDAEHDFGHGLWLRAGGGWSDLHLGRLLWDRFAEIPFDTVRTYSGQLRLQAGTRVTAEVGGRFYVRRDFERSVTVRYESQGTPRSVSRPGRAWIVQVGPTAALAWPMRGGATLRVDGWLVRQHVFQHLYGELPEASAEAIRAVARRGRRQTIPNVALSLRWQL